MQIAGVERMPTTPARERSRHPSNEVRLGLLSRHIDSNDALAKIKVSVLIVQAERDQLVLPAAADYIAGKVKHARKSYYPNGGHAPFIEDPERFNHEIVGMARE